MCRRFRFALNRGLIWPLILAACATSNPAPNGFGIQAKTNPGYAAAGTFEVYVTGTGFSPGGRVSVTYTNVPNRVGVQQGGAQATVLDNGTFSYVETTLCTAHAPADVRTVLVAADDLNTGRTAVANVPGNAWLCPF